MLNHIGFAGRIMLILMILVKYFFTKKVILCLFGY
ncbi:hypothetical protein NTHI1209_01359 [Haemophilus influenzae]|uniref:Uncharacterized protein n=1 Tax=Haemophilus influenzae TaxID=727 RepID=A0A158SY03_HAEIF|nr:hypothetical protein NTHI1209_01359 [Haemophilus influenzae]